MCSPSLCLVYLDNNKLVEVEPGIWGALKPVEEIRLYNNSLSVAAVDRVIIEIYDARMDYLSSSPQLQIQGASNENTTGIYSGPPSDDWNCGKLGCFPQALLNHASAFPSSTRVPFPS